MSWSHWLGGLRRGMFARLGRANARARPCPEPARRLDVRALEDRTLLNGHTLTSAALLPFTNHVAQASGFLQHAQDVDLFKLKLNTGDKVTAAVNAQKIGSGLDGLLRIFNGAGRQVALNNDYTGRDPQVTFQATADNSTYFVGVSGFPNTAYDPTRDPGPTTGSSTGAYTLRLFLTPGVPLAADLEGSSFQITQTAGAAGVMINHVGGPSPVAVWGDQVTIRYTIENRGGQEAFGPILVQPLLSTNNRFDGSGSDVQLPAFTIPGLPAGGSTGPLELSITLPAVPPAGFMTPGQVFLGFQIGSGAYQNSPEHGNDWEALTILQPGSGGTLSPNGRVSGMLGAAGAAEAFQVTLTESGRLTAQVHDGTTGLHTRLSLYDPSGRRLVQSDGQAPDNRDDLVAQHLPAGGPYLLMVQGLEGGTGTFTLSTEFARAVPPFKPLPTGGRPGAVVAGDFNGDGKTDLAIANYYDNTVTVLLGNGDGTFTSAGPAIQTGQGPVALVAGDFNGDGRTDLAVVNINDNPGTVSVFLGNGDGTFTSAGSAVVGPRPDALVVGDFNGDGTTDLAVANSFNNTVTVLLGLGHGSFASAGAVHVGPGPRALVAGDFNGDGKTDLATANYNGTVSVLLGTGKGTFTSAGPDIPVGVNPHALVAGDFNGDGKTDLATANYNGTVSVLLGKGDGTFTSAGPDITVGPRPSALVAADFNGDGKTDLATANFENTVTVLLGKGDGTFASAGSAIPVGRRPLALVAADFNGDGKSDLATVNENDNAVMVLLGKGDGTFASSAPAIPFVSSPRAVVAADFNGDGKTDLAVADFFDNTVTVLLGTGHGSFTSTGPAIPVGAFPGALATGDFNGDGITDLAVANAGDNTVTVLLGTGKGTFTKAGPPIQVGQFPDALVTGDFNGDHMTDLAVGAYVDDTITVLLGTGHGTFTQAGSVIPLGAGRNALAAGDFNGDGMTDLAVANYRSSTVSVLLATGQGAFARQAPDLPVGRGPIALVVGDFNGHGKIDLATANLYANTVTVLLGTGTGTFTNPGPDTAVGFAPRALLVSDFDGDGETDLAVANQYDNSVTVLLGTGHGTFTSAGLAIQVGARPLALATGSFDGDGEMDLAVLNSVDNTVSVLLDEGSATFTSAGPAIPVGAGPDALVSGDFNGDGKTDLAIADARTNTVTVLLGQGDGTFDSPGPPIPVGPDPRALVTGDFNGDGRTDLAIASSYDDTVTVLLGKGDGTFTSGPPIPVGLGPDALVAGDFTGNGKTDLAVANFLDNTVTVLLGKGDATFTSAGPAIAVGAGPDALASGDFNRDGKTDLAVANALDNTLTVLLGNGTGAFTRATISVPSVPSALVTGDFNGDGNIDLVVASFFDNTVTVLLGAGDGTFAAAGPAIPVGAAPDALAAADLNGDGKTDLVVANAFDNTLTVLLGKGDGTFTSAGPAVPAGPGPDSLAAADFNGDGKTDLAMTDLFGTNVPTLLGVGDGHFIPAGQIANGIQPRPLVADLTGDCVPDVTVLRQDGRILFRRGQPGQPGAFEPPLILNPAPAPGSKAPDFRARDLTVVARDGRFDLAALDTNDSAISLYTYNPATGTFTRTTGPNVPGLLPARIVGANLTNDRADPRLQTDLVVAAAGSNQIFVYRQNADGTFGTPDGHGGFGPSVTQGVGVSPLGIAVANVDGDGRPDILVANQFSGDVSVLLNDSAHPFAVEERFRAGTGLYGLGKLIPTDSRTTVQTLEDTLALVAGPFGPTTAGGTRSGVVALNAGSHTASVLLSDGQGGLINPQAGLTLPAGMEPTDVVMGTFRSKDPDPKIAATQDLAILDKATHQILIFFGDGAGGFTFAGSVDAGNSPTGLAVADLTRPGGGSPDGIPDLVVGNAFGDVLVLPGNGDGTFRQYQRLNLQTALTAVDPQHFVISDPSQDAVVIKNLQGVESFQQQRSQGIRAPGAIGVADVGNGTKALIVANGGGNNVLVYLGDNQGRFDPTPAQTLSVGTDPVGITVGTVDVNGQSELAVFVANQGSNDVSVLLGSGSGIGWRLTEAERLKVGDGPVSTTMATVNGVQQLVVTDSVSNDVRLLPSRGQGFFSDQPQDVTVLPAGLDPVQSLVGNFDGTGLGLLTVNAGSNDLTFFPEFSTADEKTISLGAAGDRPDAAVAVDVNGITDLFVANDGNGAIALLQSSIGGPELVATFSLAEVPHPTALALVEVGGLTQVYVTTEGQDRVFLLASFVPEGVPGLPAGSVIPNGTGETDLAQTDQAESGTNDTNPPVTEQAGPGVDVVSASSPAQPNATGDPTTDTGQTPVTDESPLTDDLMKPPAPADKKDNPPPGSATERSPARERELLADALFSRWLEDDDLGAALHAWAEFPQAPAARAPTSDTPGSRNECAGQQTPTMVDSPDGVPGVTAETPRSPAGVKGGTAPPAQDPVATEPAPAGPGRPTCSRTARIDAWFAGPLNLLGRTDRCETPPRTSEGPRHRDLDHGGGSNVAEALRESGQALADRVRRSA